MQCKEGGEDDVRTDNKGGGGGDKMAHQKSLA